MIDAVVIKEFGPTPGILASEMGDIIRDTLAQVAANHHSRHMWRHFRVDGKQRYSYKPRKGEGLSGKAFWKSYTGQKLKQKGHVNPLVWSGASETLAKIRDVRATRKRARLVQHARGLNRRNPNSDINMVEEIRTVADVEQREAVALAGKMVRRRVREIRKTKITRVS